MTLIVSLISPFDCVMGSDSAITQGGQSKGSSQKCFPIPKLKAGICAAGAYTVGAEGDPLAKWLEDFIGNPPQQYTNLKSFTTILCDTVKEAMTDDQKAKSFVAHIAGYNQGRLQHWHISNAHAEEEYSVSRPDFGFKEDTARDEVTGALQQGKSYFFCEWGWRRKGNFSEHFIERI